MARFPFPAIKQGGEYGRNFSESQGSAKGGGERAGSNDQARDAVTATRPPRAPRKLNFDWDQNNRARCEARVPIAEIEALFKRRDYGFRRRSKIDGEALSGHGRLLKGRTYIRRLHDPPRIWPMVDPANQRAVCSRRGSPKMAPAKKLKPVPKFKSDAEAERFVETADLSEYDLFANASPRDEWFAKFEALQEHAARLAARRKAAKAKAVPTAPRKRA
jgi:hypothetical protein